MMARLLQRDGFEKIIEVDDNNPPRFIKIAASEPLQMIVSTTDPLAGMDDITTKVKTFYVDQGKIGILTYIEQ